MRRLNNLVNGLAGYLQYEYGCYRSSAFNERGFSSAMVQLINGTDIECEKPHPYILAKRKPKCTDYYWTGWGNPHGNYMEFKWFGYSSPVLSSMLADIYRLGAISCRSKARTYFVIAGVAANIAKVMNSNTNIRTVKQKQYAIIRTDSKRHPDIKPSHIRSIYDPTTDIGEYAPLKVKLFNPHFSFNPNDPQTTKFGAFGFEVIGTLK